MDDKYKRNILKEKEEQIVGVVSGYRIQKYLTQDNINKLREEHFPKRGLAEIISNFFKK